MRISSKAFTPARLHWKALLASVASVSAMGTAHAAVYDLNVTIEDGDSIIAKLEYDDSQGINSLITIVKPSHANPLNTSVVAPEHTFTGYKITGISGIYRDIHHAGSTDFTITSLQLIDPPFNFIVENAPYDNGSGPVPTIDDIPHTFTDNLFNPKGGISGVNVAPRFGGMLSYGGFSFILDHPGGPENYQLFTNFAALSDPSSTTAYAGCPGTCVTATVPEPNSSLLAVLGLGMMSFISSKMKRSARRPLS